MAIKHPALAVFQVPKLKLFLWLCSRHVPKMCHRLSSKSGTPSLAMFKIEQTGSPIRRHHKQRLTLIGLGLIRNLRRHPDASLQSLIPMLSCQRCSPNAPFPKLTGSGTGGGEDHASRS
jgi:hypothetical protein